MAHLPVLATAGRSYVFAWKNLGSAFRLAWLPFLVASLPWPPGEAIGAAWWLASPLLLLLAAIVATVKAVCSSLVTVALMRVVLFDRRAAATLLPPSIEPVHVLVVAVYLGLGLLAFLMEGVLAVANVALPIPTANAAFLLLPAAYIYVGARLFTLDAAVVVSGRLPLRETWRHAAGNWWRLFALMLLCSAPALLLPSKFGSVASEIGAADFALNSDAATTLATTLIEFVVGLPLAALNAAATCYAFKALAGIPPDATV